MKSLSDSSPKEFKYIDIDPLSSSELRADIAFYYDAIRCTKSLGPKIFTNGSLFIKIPYSFWFNKLIKTWLSGKCSHGERLGLMKLEQTIANIDRLIDLTFALKFIYNNLLEGSEPDTTLMQKAISNIEKTSLYAPLLVSWIESWATNPWPLHGVEFQELSLNIKSCWLQDHNNSKDAPVASVHTLDSYESWEELKYTCFKLHSLLTYLEDRNYIIMLNNWNNYDIHSVISTTCNPTTVEIQAAQLILEASFKHTLHALSHVNRVFGKRELRQAMEAATVQYNLLQRQVNSSGLFEVYQRICFDLCVCHSSQTFNDMDLTVDILSRQQGSLNSPWLTKLWDRTKAILIYSYDAHTGQLAKRFDKDEYQLSLLAISIADSLPTPLSLKPPVTGSPPKIQNSVHREPNITNFQHAAPKAFLFNQPLLPSQLLLPIPIYRTQIKLPFYYVTHGYHGASPEAPLDTKFSFSIPVRPYRWLDNRAGVG